MRVVKTKCAWCSEWSYGFIIKIDQTNWKVYDYCCRECYSASLKAIAFNLKFKTNKQKIKFKRKLEAEKLEKMKNEIQY